MNLLERARSLLEDELRKAAFDLDEPVTVRPLHPDEAVGQAADPDLAIRRGPEMVLQAEIGSGRGQAFTDQPRTWTGTVRQALALDLGVIWHRAQTVAVLNALLGLDRFCPFAT